MVHNGGLTEGPEYLAIVSLNLTMGSAIRPPAMPLPTPEEDQLLADMLEKRAGEDPLLLSILRAHRQRSPMLLALDLAIMDYLGLARIDWDINAETSEAITDFLRQALTEDWSQEVLNKTTIAWLCRTYQLNPLQPL